MKDNFEMNIGLNISAVLNTKSKLFSSSKSSTNGLVNQDIDPNDLGFPGTLPTPNTSCIEKAIILADSLNMEINDEICFDRFNCFDKRMPQGYKITQYHQPFAKDGWIELEDGTKIKICKLILEEDIGQVKITKNNNCLLNYNHCGIPLITMNINSEINEIKNIANILKEIRKILKFNNLSDANFDNETLRVELIFSLKEKHNDEIISCVKIKNMNNFDDVEKIIDLEFDNQLKYFTNHRKKLFTTKTFVAKTNEFIVEDQIEDNKYCNYLVESNIYNFSLLSEFIEEIIETKKVNINGIKNNLLSKSIDNEIANDLMNNYSLYTTFNKMCLSCEDYEDMAKFLCDYFMIFLPRYEKIISEFSKRKCATLVEIFKMKKDDKLNDNQTKNVISYLLKHPHKNPFKMVRKYIKKEDLNTDLKENQ